MILKNFNYHRPKTLKEAKTLIKKLKSWRLFAGGTFFIAQLKNSEKYPENIIGLKNISGLSYIDKDKKYLGIGSMTTLDNIARDKGIKESFSILSECISCIATPQIRNMATIGGNICSRLPWVDLPSVLLALDAELVFIHSRPENRTLQGADEQWPLTSVPSTGISSTSVRGSISLKETSGFSPRSFIEKNVNIADFIKSPNKYSKSILKEIKIPLSKIEKYSFMRMTKTNETDIPLASVSIIKKVGKVAVSVNLGNNFSKRFIKTEEAIDDYKNNNSRVLEVFNSELALCQRDSYRKEMISICFKRALEKYFVK